MNFSEFKKSLSRYKPSEIVFVGLGNELRSDDGIARLFLEKLAQHPDFRPAHFIFAGRTPENYLGDILRVRPAAVVIIDAVLMNAPPGTIRWINDEQIINTSFSTHSYSPRLVVQYLNLQQNLSAFYLGIEPFLLAVGNGISPQLQSAVANFFEA